MNTAQIHLALNHIPVLLSVTGAILLIFAMLRKNDSLKLTAAYMLVTAALFTLPVFFTGEGTEDTVENLPGVSASIIEQHETMAQISLAIIIATGIIALAGILLKKKIAAFKMAMVTSFILALLSFGALAQTAQLGGKIRHTEIRKGNTIQNNDTGNSEQPVDNKNEKDDD